MDNHHYRHHQQPRQYHHHYPQLVDSPSSSRYLSYLPPPPPPPPSFPDDRPPLFPPLPQRHLPPPPPLQPHHHHNHPLSPHILHHPPPPPPPPSHPHNNHNHNPIDNTFNFVNSPPHHHHNHHQHQQQHQHQHQLQHRRALEDDPRDGFRSPTRVIPSNRVHVYDNHHHHHSHIEHNIEEVDRQPRFRLSELPPPPPLPASSRVSPLSPVARRSPPQFVQFDRVRREIDSPPRFREELGLESRVRVHHPDAIENQLRRDRVVERRVLGVFDRLEGDFNRDRDRDFEHHERYHPEMMPARKEIEPNSGISESRRGSLNDEVLLRGGRDDVLEENVNMRRGSGSSNGGGSREVSRSPIKFRIGGIEVDDEGSNRGRKEEVQEYNNRGTPKKNVQKKSAFLRIQPGKQQHSSSNNIRNRLGNDKTPSPNKGKESNSEFLDHRASEERVRNPVELDVSFKSNALVAKPIMAAPSCSGVDCNVNNSLNDLDVRIEGNSFPKVESLTNSSSVSKREGKGIKNRIRVSPIMKRLGDPNSVEVCGIHSESSSGRSSSVSGSITCKADRKGEVSGKVNKNAALDHVSSLTVRKKRKAISPLSRLSRSVSTKTDSGHVNEDCSASKPCDDSIPSDVSVKCLEKESSCGGNVIDSNQNISVDMGIIDVSKSSTGLVQEEVLGHPVSEASESERMGEIGMSEHFPGSQGSLKAGLSSGHVNMEGISPDEHKISNPDEDVTKPVEKCSLDIYIEKQSVKDQDMAPALVNNGSEEGSSELVIHVVDNRNSNDNCCGNVDTLDFVENMNSISIPANVLDKENIVDLSCSLVDADKSCENQVLSSPENATIGLSLGGLYSDKNYEPESRYSVNQEQIESFLMDVCNNKRTSLSNDDDVAIGLELVRNSVSDVRDRNDIQEQQCQGSETKLVNDESTLGREGNPKICVDAGGVLAFSVDKDSSLLNRKRKSKSEPESLDLRITESCYQAGSLSFSIENATLPVEKHSSAVSGSSCVESDVLHVNEFAGSCVKGMNSMNHPPDLCPIEHSSSFGKKRKIYPLEPVFSDAPESKSSDLPLSAKSLTPVADEPSANHSPQFSEGFELQKSVIIGKDVDVVDRAASNLCAETCSLAGNTISEFLCSDSCLSITENTPPDVEQFKLPDSGCLQKVDESLMTAVTNDGSGLIALGTNEGKDNLQCLPSDHTRDAEQESLAKNMDCDDAVAQNSNPSSLSGCLQSCFDSPRDGVTANFDVLHTPSNLGLTESSSLFPSSLDTSISSPVFHVISGEKLDKDDKKPKQAFAEQNSNTSQANLLPESHKKSLKPGISVTSGVQPSAQKGLSKSSKQGKTTISSSNVMIRQRRNVLTRPEASTSASHLSAVSKPSNKSQTFPVKPRTWHRASNLTANIPVKKPSVGITPPQRALSGKAVKVQDTSYIRKGNSLVRNPITGVATSGSRAVGASNGQPRPNKTDKIRKIVSSVMTESTGLPDVLVTGGRSAPIEMPKTPPLPCSSKASDNDVVYSRECTSSLNVDHPDGKDNDEALNPDVALNSLGGSETAVNRASEDPGTLNDADLLGSNYEKMIYIKHKSNQVIAALKTSQSPSLNIDNATATTSDVNYYKRRKNQLIRASSDGNIQQMAAVNKDSSKSLSQRAFHASSGRSFTRGLSNKVKATKSSLVWKLGDSKSCGKGVDSLRSRRLLSHLLPWKRATYWSRKLLSSKKRGAVYVRSSRGFSLRRSKVISLPGTSLKWSKSMEKRSKKIGEEAAQAVAAMDSVQKSGSLGVSSKAESSLKMHPGERIFRIGVFRYRMDSSRRTLQRISDEDPSDFTASKTEKDPRKTYVPKRLLIGSDEYVRIGNGNQLVRDPKRRTRILASEKVRWSLHTARMRLAKKRKFCQFFTRFGKCNKGEGKCSFMHDPSKIAVCTKFLKGLCSNSNCKLTHKVIPERMPDCSFFLQGLCSNEKCPYRHVSVNPKASICESFLRGYCAEGNECRKKHSYICPEFEASGSCPQGSKCKLYHPKKGKTKKRKGQRDRKNAKGRYFGSDLSVIADPETKPILLRNHAEPDEVSSVVVQGDLGDFVSLDVSDDETQEDGPTIEHTFLPQDGPLNSHLDNTDELIKPLRLLGRL